MRRIAAHQVYWKTCLPLHVIEVDEQNRLCRVFPLTDEIAGTEFWDGVIYPAPVTWKGVQTINTLDALAASGITEQVEIGSVITIHRLP